MLVIELDPTTKTYFEMGMTHYNRGDYLRAAEQWKLVVKDDPSFAAGHRYLALAYEKLDWRHKAKKRWEVYLKVETNEIARAQIAERLKRL